MNYREWRVSERLLGSTHAVSFKFPMNDFSVTISVFLIDVQR